MGNRSFFLSTVFLVDIPRLWFQDRGRHGAGCVYPRGQDRSGPSRDRVQIVVESAPGKWPEAEGSVLKVLEHANKEVVGVLPEKQGLRVSGFRMPTEDFRDIFIPQGCDMVLSPA